MREPPVAVVAVRHRSGITPACAGTTRPNQFQMPPLQDHPRVCGNHGFLYYDGIEETGSPPRVREPLRSGPLRVGCHGITPACAGTTLPGSFVLPSPRDHPRVCGNHFYLSEADTERLGSPPRVREPQIKDPIKSAFLSRRLSKNIHFLRELKNQLRILQSSMRYFIRNTI